MSVMENNSIFKLSDNDLENVSGGVIFNAWDIEGADPDNPWEVLDDHTGKVLARTNNRDDAIALASRNGQNHVELNWDQVQELRGLK